jgi:hypothetical protein
MSSRRKRQAFPLPADLHQRLDWSIEETMGVTGLGRPAVKKKVKDGIYRHYIGPRGEMHIEPASVRRDNENQFAQPPQPPKPRNPFGRHGDPSKPKAEALEAPEAAPQRGRGRPGKQIPAAE